jgi:diguanylate cyclase (GGDEF)-like protein
MQQQPQPELELLKAFEGALKEGLLLDEALSGILTAALHFFDAPVVAILPGGGAPPMTRSGHASNSAVAERRLNQHLEEILTQGRARKVAEGGLSFFGAPVKIKEQTRAAFGVALDGASRADGETDEAVRLFARTLSHVLERDRTLSTLMKRREEAVALFELASGAFLSLNPEEVIRLTVASLSRELEFDRVQAFRFSPDSREVEEIHSQGQPSGVRPAKGRHPIDEDDLLVRCLAAHGAAFDDDESTGMSRRRRMALPLHAGDFVFGFLTMSRRGGFVLTPQEMRLAQELSKLAAGALEKARLLDSERKTNERIAFVARLHTALSGLTDAGAIVSRTVEEVGPHFDLDLCTVRLLPSGDLPGARASWVRSGQDASSVEVPDALLTHLSAEGSHVLIADASDALGKSLLPVGAAMARLTPPLSLLAVPLAYRGSVVGVLAAVASGRPDGLSNQVLRSFEAIAVEVSLAITSARLLLQERESYRFLDRLREVGRSLTTTFDLARIKQTLCEQSVTLLKADAGQFWDADPEAKAFRITTRFGADVGDALNSVVGVDKTTHPVARTFLDKTLTLSATTEGAAFFPGNPPGAGAPLLRAAAIPLLYADELVGVLSIAGRGGKEEWPPDLKGRLELLADAGAVALHNARLMKTIEQQTERDGQTGLYNRASLTKRLESELRRAERNGQSIAVAHVKMDGLADAIQRLGPSFGDSILPKGAARLVRSTRAVNLVARDQGDRFWILIFEAAKVQAHRAMRSVQKSFEGSLDPRLDQMGVKLSLTAGISVYPDDAFDTPTLLSGAQSALEEAVKAGPGSVVLYHAPAQDPVLR